MTLIWIESIYCYYIISFQIKFIRGDVYTNATVSSISELISYIITGFILNKLGIKKTVCLLGLSSLIGMLYIILVNTNDQYWLATFILAARFGVAGQASVAYIATFQLFAVDIVSTSFGICNILARICCIFAPYVAEMKPDLISQLTFVVVVIIAMIASVGIIDP